MDLPWKASIVTAAVPVISRRLGLHLLPAQRYVSNMINESTYSKEQSVGRIAYDPSGGVEGVQRGRNLCFGSGFNRMRSGVLEAALRAWGRCRRSVCTGGRSGHRTGSAERLFCRATRIAMHARLRSRTAIAHAASGICVPRVVDNAIGASPRSSEDLRACHPGAPYWLS
jgi:hypothetical protein